MSTDTFCPHCGRPATWVRRQEARAIYGAAIDLVDASISRTVCGSCAPAWDAWLDDDRHPESFVDAALIERWLDALTRFDSPTGSASRDAREVAASSIVGTRWTRTRPVGQVVEVEGHRFDGTETVWQTRIVAHRDEKRVGTALSVPDSRLRDTFVLLPEPDEHVTAAP